MSKDNYIYATKGKMQTRFTAMIWQNMGSNKNGWTEITKEQFDGKAPTGKSDSKPKGVEDEAAYRALYDQGKGFETDEKFAEALAKYEAAHEIKPSPALKGKINKMTSAIDRKEVLELAETELAAGNFEEAIEAFQSAQEIEETKDVKDKIKEAQKGLDESLTK